MTDQEINIAVAEAVGLRKTLECPDCHGFKFTGSELDHDPCARCKCTGRVEAYFQDLPNYCSNLNAMHEAEMWLVKEFNRQLLFGQHLRWLCRDKNVWHAEARQRAEAFLRALGKWRD